MTNMPPDSADEKRADQHDRQVGRSDLRSTEEADLQEGVAITTTLPNGCAARAATAAYKYCSASTAPASCKLSRLMSPSGLLCHFIGRLVWHSGTGATLAASVAVSLNAGQTSSVCSSPF